ncbi:MAG: hypothetical protein A2Z03_02425 [Chloroflexi bacterium RBG_16_56_8]|nr:MAG: hypothetical protein A2Z03_02425 [Chloroflexi bacterium RBG_16_56_8]
MPKSKPQAELSANAWNDLRRLPGSIRRRITIEINRLEDNPRPSNSKRLSFENEAREVRRVRIEQWRIVYWIREGQPVIVAIRKRPPYNYENIAALLGE